MSYASVDFCILYFSMQILTAWISLISVISSIVSNNNRIQEITEDDVSEGFTSNLSTSSSYTSVSKRSCKHVI